MYISMENLKITEMQEKHGETKKGKWVEYKKPVIVPKVVFDAGYTNLMDIASEIKTAATRSPEHKITVSFEIQSEY